MRQDARLTQIELAEKLEVPQSFISKIETGERALKAYEQFAYARVLGMNTADFASHLEHALRNDA